MATRALSDPDFTYFAEDAQIKAKCNYCCMILEPSTVEHHRKLCKEHPRNLHLGVPRCLPTPRQQGTCNTRPSSKSS